MRAGQEIFKFDTIEAAREACWLLNRYAADNGLAFGSTKFDVLIRHQATVTNTNTATIDAIAAASAWCDGFSRGMAKGKYLGKE